jgi:8-oxo-dGTP pyrophosphatase MutT (NUDIX family)
MLTGSDAVAAILLLDDGRYVMQLRDDEPDIWYPNHWGCFGGAVEPGESPEQALARELTEEIELTPRPAKYFTRFDFDMGTLGLNSYYRIYYLVRVRDDEMPRLKVHEGREMRAFDGVKLLHGERVTPYDAFALQLFHERRRIGRGWRGETRGPEEL